MVSLCKKIWQVFLSQAIGIGIGIGFLFLPSISVLSQYFFKKRSLAIGIAVTGSSVGGIVLPIMLNHLIQSHGFEKAVQYSGYLLLGCLVVANALMHPRLPPNPNAPPKPSPRVIFGDKAYTVLILGLFFVAWGLFFPVFYLQVGFCKDVWCDIDPRSLPKSMGSTRTSRTTPSRYSTPPLYSVESLPTFSRINSAP